MTDDLARAIEAYQAILDNDPADWATRLLLADAYADAGDPVREYGQRWQVENHKRPYLDGDGGNWSSNLGPTPCYIQRDIFKFLTHWHRSISDSWRAWPTRREAEDALAEALQQTAIIQT